MKRIENGISNAASRWLHMHGVKAPRWTTVSGEDGRFHVTCTRSSLKDADGVRKLHAVLAAALDHGMPLVELDLGAVDQADTKLIASLVVLARQARKAHARLMVYPSAKVREQVSLCLLDPILAN